MGQLENVRSLVEKKNYKPMQRDHSGLTALHVAAIVGNVQVLKYFVTECNCSPARPGPLGLTPLHLASEHGHLDVVKYLVNEQFIDPDCEDEYGIPIKAVAVKPEEPIAARTRSKFNT